MVQDVIQARIVFDTSGLEKLSRGVSSGAGVPNNKNGGTGGASDIKQALNKIPGIGSLSSIAGPLAAISVGVGLTVSVLKGIKSSMKKMSKTLEDAAPEFKASKEIQKKIFDLALRPMATVITVLMKPFLILQMLAAKKALQAARPILKQLSSGEISAADAADQIMPIFEEAMTEISFLTQKMNESIGPLVAYMDGFIYGIELIFNNFLTGLGSWVEGFKTALDTSFTTVPDSLVDTIITAVDSGAIDIEDVPLEFSTYKEKYGIIR